MEPQQYMGDLLRIFTQYRYPLGSESGFQNGLESVLRKHEIPYFREWDLGNNFGRIDFYLPQFRTGIELKVKGSPSEVARQLHRYCQSPDVAAVVLLTGRHRLARMPASINGKPLMSVWLGWGQI